MNRELLEKPFPQDQIKQREGNFGRMVDYVEGHTVIQRLNDAFDGEWSFDILSHEVRDTEIIVLGRITAEGITKTQFGSSRATISKETGEYVSLADDLKAAATDAIKKCATLFGVGIHLYGNGGDTADTAGNAQPSRNQAARNNAARPKGSADRISNKQLNFIIDLGRKLGLDSRGLDQESIRVFGVKLAYLKRSEASAFIDALKHNRKAA